MEMENLQPLIGVAMKAVELVRNVLGSYDVVQEIVKVIGVYVFWWYFFSTLYYRIRISFHVRHRNARHNKLLKEHRDRSEKEQTAVEQHWPWPQVDHSRGHCADPSQESLCRKTAQQPCVNREKDNGAVAAIVPLMMCCRCSLSVCTKLGKSCKKMLNELAVNLQGASGQSITCLETDSGCVTVQMQLHLEDLSAGKLREIAAKEFCSEITVQLGSCGAFCLIQGDEVKTMNMDESVAADGSDRVPVIFNSAYKAGKLTVEGLNLAEASIQIVTKDMDCFTLEKRSNEPGVTVSGSGDLEIHTYTFEFPEDQLIAECSNVIAFRNIDKDGYKIRFNSLPVQIRDDSLRTVFGDIFPLALFVFYAAKQLLSSVGFATPIISWLICFLIVALTSTLPESTETRIEVFLEKFTYVRFIFSDAYDQFRRITSPKTYVYDPFRRISPTTYAKGPFRRISPTTYAKDPFLRPSYENHVIEKENLMDSKRMRQGETSAEVDQPKSNCAPAHGSRFVHSSDWQWPIYDTIYEGERSYLKLRQESKVEEAEKKAVPFEVIYLNLKGLPWANQVQVVIYSSFLKSRLPVEMDRWKCKKSISIDGPELFRNYENLNKVREASLAKLESSEPSSSADPRSNKEDLQDITHLVRFMDQEFEEIKPMFEGMRNECQVTWDMLWAFFPPGERVVYTDQVTDECVCGEVSGANYVLTNEGPVLFIKVTTRDYNCHSWSEYTNTVRVPQFPGDRKISSLSIHPVRFEEDPNATENSFLDHGKRFCELSMMQSNSYMNYEGPIVHFIRVDNRVRVVKENADGRVMIDLRSFSKMNPDYAMGTAKPPCEILRGSMPVVPIDIRNDSSRMFAPSFVYGFSFRLKKWGCFSVIGFTEIQFNDSAYDALVMNQEMKDLTFSLVKERLKEGSKKKSQDKDAVDLIANKGEGCIILCYGPPGTGKTLTAESLSEKLECPLWCLSVFELGVTPAALETTLVKVLDVAASWGAILLLDEADVYLERRTSKDLVRNSMTGVFLRHLEYYRGVLFLTTNRDSEFDEAICSRITMFLYYGRLDEHQRMEIWKSLFGRVDLENYTDGIVAEFSQPDFNGREIIKIVTTAQTLANHKEEKLEFQHIRDSLKVYKDCSMRRASLLNSSTARGCIPAYQQPRKLQEEISHSEFAPASPPKRHPCSSESSDSVDVEAFEGTPRSSNTDVAETLSMCRYAGVQETPPSCSEPDEDRVPTASVFFRKFHPQ